MYCDVTAQGHCNMHTEGSHDTSWHAVFKQQDDANAQAQDGLDPDNIVDGQEQRHLTEDINRGRQEALRLSCAGVSQSFSSAPKPLSSELPPPQMKTHQFDSEYMSQTFKDVSVNTFKRHGRAILTVAQVQAIFRYKSASLAKDSEKAGALARMYGVCAKTVRDIWGGRTWYRATFHLDQSKPFTPERLQKKAGRPRGAKDRKPRARKIAFDGSCADDSFCHMDIRCDEAGTCDSSFQCESAESSDWTDFPPAGGTVAPGFEDPFGEDWNQWLREDVPPDVDGTWETESPARSDEEEEEEEED